MGNFFFVINNFPYDIVTVRRQQSRRLLSSVVDFDFSFFYLVGSSSRIAAG